MTASKRSDITEVLNRAFCGSPTIGQLMLFAWGYFIEHGCAPVQFTFNGAVIKIDKER